MLITFLLYSSLTPFLLLYSDRLFTSSLLRLILPVNRSPHLSHTSVTQAYLHTHVHFKLFRHSHTCTYMPVYIFIYVHTYIHSCTRTSFASSHHPVRTPHCTYFSARNSISLNHCMNSDSPIKKTYFAPESSRISRIRTSQYDQDYSAQNLTIVRWNSDINKIHYFFNRQNFEEKNWYF